jgi:hypothetical protein
VDEVQKESLCCIRKARLDCCEDNQGAGLSIFILILMLSRWGTFVSLFFSSSSSLSQYLHALDISTPGNKPHLFVGHLIKPHLHFPDHHLRFLDPFVAMANMGQKRQAPSKKQRA